MRRELKIVAIGLVCISLIGSSLPPVSGASPGTQGIDVRSLDKGEVVAQGDKRDIGCFFEEEVTIRVTLDHDFSGTFSSSFGVDEDCKAYLSGVEENGEKGMGVQSSTIVNNRVYHYGSGGHNDVLTQVTDEISFTHDGSQATIVDSEPVVCMAASDWKIDDCQTEHEQESGDPAYKVSHGDFHWDPWWTTPSYYHTLKSWTGGYADGDPYCTYSWSGTVASGVDNDCTIS